MDDQHSSHMQISTNQQARLTSVQKLELKNMHVKVLPKKSTTTLFLMNFNDEKLWATF